MSNCPATSGPTCAVSPSTAIFPKSNKSYSPNLRTAAASTRLVHHVSLPANALEDNKTALSAPLCKASRSTSSAEAGPMLTATISAPVCLFNFTANCKAYKSSGFVRVMADERFSVRVTGSISTFVDKGTCFKNTIYRFISFVFYLPYIRTLSTFFIGTGIRTPFLKLNRKRVHYPETVRCKPGRIHKRLFPQNQFCGQASLHRQPRLLHSIRLRHTTLRMDALAR